MICSTFYLYLGADHSRRNLSYGFSQKTINQQEPMIMKHVDLLISKLHTNCGNPVDMVPWYAFVVFDLVGDLTLGETFNCLETSKFDVSRSVFYLCLLILTNSSFGRHCFQVSSKIVIFSV